LTLFRPALGFGHRGPFSVRADIFEVREPHARVSQWRLSAEPAPEGGWRLSGRRPIGSIEGLVHLSLDAQGFRAGGLRLELEDFVLTMERGTLFTSPEPTGRTVLVFVGRGEVRFAPRPASEAEQLARFCGSRQLVARVDRAFARVHPDDLESSLTTHPLRPDPDSARRLDAALEYYRGHVERFFLLDAAAPRSPWWLLPSPGDAVVMLDAHRRRELTYSLSRSEPEAVSLVAQEDERQICRYPASGGSTDYDEDEGRVADVLRRDVSVSLDPEEMSLRATATLRIRLLKAGAVLRLSLDDALRIHSISSSTAGPLRFFRVRGQNAVVVSLGALRRAAGSFELTVRYAGRIEPTPIRDELIQLPGRRPTDTPLQEASVYTHERAWYPWIERDDHATSRLRVELPAGLEVLSGGRRRVRPAGPGRRVVEFEMEQPGRYLTLAVGPFAAVGEVRARGVGIRGQAVPRLRGALRDDLETAREIVEYYVAEFGPPPYPELTLAGFEGEAPGGHSPPGMMLLAFRPPGLRPRRLRDDPALLPGEPDFFLAHELAHQWWGHGVAGQNYRERWISEAFAQYAATLWVREARGEEAFQRVLEHFDRWARRYSDDGPIHLGTRVGHIDGQPRAFRAVIYDKGAYVLHMLRRVVGVGAFRAALTNLQSRVRYGKIGSRDVQDALESASGLDLAPYFDSWVFGTALPELRYAWKGLRVEGRHRVELDVRTRHLPGPVPLDVLIRTETGNERRLVTLPAAGGVFTLELPARARRVELNTDGGLLARVEKL